MQGTKSKLTGHNSEFLKLFMQIMMNPANVLLVQKIQMAVEEMAIPIYSSIIKQGVDEGVYKVDLIDETSVMLISISKSLQGRFQLLFQLESSEQIKCEFERLMTFFTRSVERLLAAEEGCLPFVTPELSELMNQFIQKMNMK